MKSLRCAPGMPSDEGPAAGHRGKEQVKRKPPGQHPFTPKRHTPMPYPVRHTMLFPLLAAAGLALALAGCAVPVASDYGYSPYDGYGSAFPPPTTYVVPSGPPVVYGAPPVVLGGQIWFDSPPRPTPWRWRDDSPRRHDWRGPAPSPRPSAPPPPPRAWQHDGDRAPRPWMRPPDPPRASPPPQQGPRRWPEGGPPGHRGGGSSGRDFP